MHEIETPVLIVGGGPTGLAASLALSRHGVRSLLIERHPGTSQHPKARGLNVRTLELFRVWGIEAAVRAAGDEFNKALDVVWAPTLMAPETLRLPYGGDGERWATDSPTTSAGCAQEKVEVVLLEAARTYSLADARFGHELTGMEQDRTGVSASVLDRSTGEHVSIRADWVIAADGAHSTVRSMLGIGTEGPGPLFHRMGIHFRSDLREFISRRSASMYFVSPAGGGGPIGPHELTENRWRYQAPFHPERGERAEDFPTERCIQLVRDAVGIPDLQVEVLGAEPWSGCAAVAKHFRDGRVFLAGDAAHEIAPAGGQGLNVDILSVHNLAWKLAGHLHSWAGEALLDTYEQERRPFAMEMNADVARNIAAGSGGRLEQFSNRGRVLGVSYASAAVVPDGTDLPTVANPVIEYVPCARPGSRAPHMWLWRDGQRISTLDLYDTDFVLLTGPSGLAWYTAAQEIAKCLGVPLRSFVVGPNGPLIDTSGEWPSLYGIAPDGALVVCRGVGARLRCSSRRGGSAGRVPGNLARSPALRTRIRSRC
jgi:2-polyprenyl-6-methoxyphenol hydroxylase-like FAD-dependent oxidoreductase